MIVPVFIDSDVVLDAALAREPFYADSNEVLLRAERGAFMGYTSPLCIANLHYLLTKLSSKQKSLTFLYHLLSFIRLTSIHHATVIDAFQSDFTDFEDAIQHCCAKQEQCRYIVTRNLKDYSRASVEALSPADFLGIALLS